MGHDRAISTSISSISFLAVPFPSMAMRALARRLRAVRIVQAIALRPPSLRTLSYKVYPHKPFPPTVGELSRQPPSLPIKYFSSACSADRAISDVRPLLELLKEAAHLQSESEAIDWMDKSDVHLTQELIYSVIWALREDWKLAFFAFKWGEKFSCCDEKVCNLMVNVLGSHGKFNTALCLIRDLHRAKIDIRQSMLTMIDRSN